MSTEALIRQFGNLKLSEANEATTRLKLIDKVMFEVLGWTHSDVEVEERISEDGVTEYADYIFRTGMTSLVVEAKKVGESIIDSPNIRRLPLNRKTIESTLGPAIIQARDYARKKSIPFAVVTNGNCWIVFAGVRVDDVPFEKSHAVVFPNIRSILERDYAEFSDLLSRSAVISGSLESEFLGRIENQIDERRLNRFFPNGFSRISRHSLFPIIEGAITVAFTEDMVNADPNLLEKCYVRTAERIRFDARIQMHIAKRESVVSRSPLRPMRDRTDQGIANLIESAGSRVRPVALLILGSVGSGKTTFLEYTRKVACAEKFTPDPSRPYPHWVHVDFRQFIASETPSRFIYESLRSYIASDPFLSDYERCIRHVYKEEIDSLFRGPMYLLATDEAEKKRHIASLIMRDYNEVNSYVNKVLSYAAARSPIFLVVDNVDQFEDPDIQKKIFSDSMAIAHKNNLNLICSLREETYVVHRNTAIFDAFDFEPVVIDPPDIKSVLSRRFFIARQLLTGKPTRFQAENGADISLSDTGMIIDLLQASVLGSEIGNLIDVLSASDVRLCLRMTREFLQSGYTASGKALTIYQNSGKYQLPQHEALRAIMFGSRSTYFEEYSVIGNIFDAKLKRTELQNLRMFALASLVQHSSHVSFQYLSGEEFCAAFRKVGFGDDVTLKILEDLCRLRFATTLSHTAAALEANFMPTRLGGYVIRELISNFTYVENVMVDTFISDTDTWNRVRSLTDQVYALRDPVGRLQKRKQRVEVFFDYLKNKYRGIQEESTRRGLAPEWCSNPLASAEHVFHENLKRATRSAERNYAPVSGAE
jgi:hypothetical protein